jgi:hypothetical protein
VLGEAEARGRLVRGPRRDNLHQGPEERAVAIAQLEFADYGSVANITPVGTARPPLSSLPQSPDSLIGLD